MAPDTNESANVSAPPAGARDKVRLRFRKDGSLRWLSHHDLLRTFERVLRRACLPVRSTQGFNPHPRLVFALSLPLGVIGRAEVVELELDESISPDEVLRRLSPQCPPGLQVLDACRIPTNASARVVGFTYGLAVPPERQDATRERLPAALAETECWVERTKPAPRRLNIRPFVRGLRIDEAGWLEMDLWLTSSGTARPEEVLRLVGLSDVLLAGGVLERVRLELEDDPPPAGRQEGLS